MAARERFPALVQFFRGYLHQDAAAEYGSAEAAVRGFKADADARQWRTLQGEWQEFLKSTRGKSLAEINSFLTGPLGGSWTFATKSDFKRFSNQLLGAKRPTKTGG